MSTGTIIVIAIPVLITLAVVVGFGSLRKKDAKGLGHMSRETRNRDAGALDQNISGSNEARELEKSVAMERVSAGVAVPLPKVPEVWTPPDADAIGVSRRQFLNRSSITLMTLGLSVFGAANIAFLWPRPTAGFGSKVKIGTIDSVNTVINSSSPAVNFAYFSEAQTYLQPYPMDQATQASAEAVYKGATLAGIKQGYVALWQKCPHLGCKVPVCGTSQWFECPCHGSQYNRVGEKKVGPAPRGMDHFPVIIDGENVIIDTGTVSLGAVIGTDTTGQGLEGPHCA
jgi:cytochrome b6-f complex iron-sulfur subunit